MTQRQCKKFCKNEPSNKKEIYMAKIIDIEGIGLVYAEKLIAVGVRTTNRLLKKGATPQGRAALEKETGISHEKILEWVNHADLFRIKGVGEEYSDLLEEAGVDTVPELAQRNAQNLYAKLVEVNDKMKLVRQLPSQRQVADWVEQAKMLPRKIEY
jgi:predicted flap endonuclease-1-like 5' DNA nuclease